MTEELLPFCACGECGLRVTKKSNMFIKGHNRRGIPHTQKAKKKMSDTSTGIPLPPRTPEHCAALSDSMKNSDANKAQIESMRGIPNSPEHNAAISKGKTGVPRKPNSPEHNAAISTANKESGAVKANNEKQRGGFDIVKHHHIYDHSDLSKYTIEMTRQKHARLHRQMRSLNIQVPHINTGHENNEELELMEYIKTITSKPL